MAVSDAQMRLLAGGLESRWILRFLTTCYPDEPGITLHRVEAAANDGRRRGLAEASLLRRYVHLAFLLGWELETDPGLDWARQILSDDSDRTQATRLVALQTAILRQLPDDDG